MSNTPTPKPAETTGEQPINATMRSRKRRWWLVAGFLFIAATALVFAWPKKNLPEGVTQKQYDRAEVAFNRAFNKNPDHADVLMLLAELAVRDGNPDVALQCFQQIPSGHDRYGASARFQQAQVLLRMNRAIEAEVAFREYLKMAETDRRISTENVKMARKWLTFILSVELRFEDRKPILQQAHADGRADVYDSEQLFFPTLLIWNSSVGRARLRDFLEADPHDPTLLTANARYMIGEGRLTEAEELLKNLRQKHPNDLPCLAASLQCAYEQADFGRMEQLLKDAPDAQEHEPWLLTEMRGEFALFKQKWQQAANQFQKLLQKDPANPVCHMGLAKAYAGLGLHAKRQAIQERSLLLSRIRVALAGITSETEGVIASVAETCRRLGFENAATTFEQHATMAVETAP